MLFKRQLLEKQKPIFFYIPCSVLKYIHKFFSIPPINIRSLILLPLRVGGLVTPFWGKEPGRSSSVSFPRLCRRRHRGALLAPSFGSLTPGDTSSHVPRILKSNAESSAGPGTKASCQQPVRKSSNSPKSEPWSCPKQAFRWLQPGWQLDDNVMTPWARITLLTWLLKSCPTELCEIINSHCCFKQLSLGGGLV